MIHTYRMNNINIVLDINSGAVHVVDDLVYKILDFYENKKREEIFVLLENEFDREKIEEAFSEIKSLEQKGLLFSEDVYENSLDAFKNRNSVVKALCLNVAHSCNLKCSYCFAEEGKYHKQRSLMSEETGKAALDFLIAASGSRKNLEVDFFGGEPLMNFEVVKKLVEYGRAQEKVHNKKFRFTLTTNGVLLDEEKMKFIHENLQNIVLSIDGRKETNDFMRKKLDDSGSYDDIMPKFIKMAELNNQTNYYVRGTFTRENLDFSEDVLHLADAGFKQISVEPVVSDKKESYALTENDLPLLFEEYEKLAVEMIKRKKEDRDFNFFHFMIDLTGGPCVIKRLTGCGAGCEYLAVTPEGDLYPCHQFVGIDEYKIGTLEEGVTNVSLKKKFSDCNVYAKEECKQCWAKFYCSGGCAANAFYTHGTLLEPYEIGCELQRKRIECAIMIKAATSLPI